MNFNWHPTTTRTLPSFRAQPKTYFAVKKIATERKVFMGEVQRVLIEAAVQAYLDGELNLGEK